MTDVNVIGLVLRAVLLVGVVATQLVRAAESDDSLTSAEALYREEGPEIALPVFERLAEAFRAGRDERQYAIALGLIGECHWRLGDFDRATIVLNEALTLKRRLGDRAQEARTINVLGLVAWHRGEYGEATDRFTETATIAREIGDAKLEGAALNNQSLVGDELGDYHASLARYQQVLALFRSIDFARGEGDVLGNIGGVKLLLGRFQEAESYYREALAISERLRSATSLGQDHGNLAMSLLGQGRIAESLTHFDKAAEYATEAGMRRDQAYWQRGKANALASHANHDAALGLYRAAIATYVDIGAAPEHVEALHDLGGLYLSLGDAASSRRCFEESLTIAQKIGLARAITTNLIASGDLAIRQGNVIEASRAYEQALERAKESGETVAWTESLLRLASVASSQNDAASGPPVGPRTGSAAAAFTEQALEIARQTGSQNHEAQALLQLADLQRTSEPDVALANYAAAQSLAERIGDPELRWQVHYGRARMLIDRGALDAAAGELQAALAIIEGVRERLREQRFRSGYLQDKTQVYVELARLLLRLGRTADAFSTAERLRTFRYVALVEDSATEAPQRAGQGREVELRERIRQLQRSLREEHSREQAERREPAVDTFSAELASAEREYGALLDDRRRAPGRFGELSVPVTYEVLRAQLARDEAVVEYLVDHDAVVVFVITADGLNATTIPLAATDLAAKIELIRDLVLRPENDQWRYPAESLADLLIGAIVSGDAMKEVRHLHIVPHGELNYLPFALLPLDDGMLVDRYTVSYLPSAAALALDETKGQTTSSMLVVTPARARLRHARAEVDTVEALFRPQSRLLTGTEATETAFRANAHAYRNLHLATHGYFNKQNPLLSGLELEPDETEDGQLEVHEIMGLELAADLVTLSACETGLGAGHFGDIPAGDDFIGLTRAFIYAGSTTVLATLWEVDDRSTGELMARFYRYLAESDGRVNKATALALAQRDTRASRGHEHPYYWAAFLLVGDTRAHESIAISDGRIGS
jgi:CHAT domain-containing protein